MNTSKSNQLIILKIFKPVFLSLIDPLKYMSLSERAKNLEIKFIRLMFSSSLIRNQSFQTRDERYTIDINDIYKCLTPVV